MTAEQLFWIANVVATVAWLPPVFLPRSHRATGVVPIVVPGLLARAVSVGQNAA